MEVSEPIEVAFRNSNSSVSFCGASLIRQDTDLTHWQGFYSRAVVACLLHLYYSFLPLDCDNVEQRASVFRPKHPSFLTQCLPYSRHSIIHCQGRESCSFPHPPLENLSSSPHKLFFCAYQSPKPISALQGPKGYFSQDRCLHSFLAALASVGLDNTNIHSGSKSGIPICLGSRGKSSCI